MSKKRRIVSIGLAGAFVFLAARMAAAKSWSKKEIEALPDSAFASVETGPKGEKLRHLPYRDSSGQVDPAHLRSALRLWGHVKWDDQADAQPALQLLKKEETGLCAAGKMKCAAAKPAKTPRLKHARLKKPSVKAAAAPKAKAPKVAKAPRAKKPRLAKAAKPKAPKTKVARKPSLKKAKPQAQPA